MELKLWRWILPGLAGMLLFAVLQERFNYHANGSVPYSREVATDKTETLFSKLGIEESDSLGIIPFRLQRISLYNAIQDSLKENAPTPSELNRANFHLHGWQVIAASQIGMNESFNLVPSSIYEASGIYKVEWDNAGKARFFEQKPERGGYTFLMGQNDREFAAAVVQETFGHDLTDYEFVPYENGDDTRPDFIAEQNSHALDSPDPENVSTLYRWSKTSGHYREYIELNLQPHLLRNVSETEVTEMHGVTVNRFEAYHEIEKIPPSDLQQEFTVFFLIVIAFLILINFLEGFGQIFKGKVDWNRILLVSLMIAMCVYGWRFIFLMNFTELFTFQARVIVQFNQILYGIVMGFFAAIAYIGWEGYSRTEKAFQISLMDAFWRGKFYLKETGDAIIKGFSLAGILLGITALFLSLSGAYFYQSDSQFGFVEILNRPFFLSLNMSVLVVAAVCSVGLAGVVFNFFNKRIRNKIIAFFLSILLGGVLFAGLGRSFGTNSPVTQEIFLFTLIVIPIFFAYKFSGVVTVFSGLWLYASVTNILPYIGSASPDVAFYAWGQLALASSILLFGVVALRFAPSITSVSSYVPDYEKKLIRNLRFENEMLIARETQEKLMPLNHPETKDFELYGYFMPSSEVGGDYFDYVTESAPGGKKHLTLTVVDVSGKSMRAAMHAVFTSGLLRSRMYTDHPSKILKEISPVIYEKTDSQTFITCIVGRYEPESRILKLANAGHCLPILKRDGKTTFIQTPDPKYPLGLRETVAYLDISIELQSGDIILFYSDGFPEAVNQKGERIGFDKALEFIQTLDTDELKAQEICSKIREYIRNFSIEKLADDTTILCLKIK